jgi:hypothetical protein
MSSYIFNNLSEIGVDVNICSVVLCEWLLEICIIGWALSVCADMIVLRVL